MRRLAHCGPAITRTRCNLDEIRTLAHEIVEALEDKQAENILLLDIEQVSSFADFFVICSGTSERQLRALAQVVVDVSDAKRRTVLRDFARQAEGGWILIDLGDVLVHIFSAEQRAYYDLESLWSEARVLLHIQ